MSEIEDATKRVDGLHKRLSEPAVDPSKQQVCSEPGCSAVKNPVIPEYSPLQPMTGQALGWYSGDDGEFCPKHIAEMMAKSNRRAYTYWSLDGAVIETAHP